MPVLGQSIEVSGLYDHVSGLGGRQRRRVACEVGRHDADLDHNGHRCGRVVASQHMHKGTG